MAENEKTNDGVKIEEVGDDEMPNLEENAENSPENAEGSSVDLRFPLTY